MVGWLVLSTNRKWLSDGGLHQRYKQMIERKVTYTTMHSDNIFNFIINFNFQNLLNLCLLPLDANNGKTVYNDVL